MDDDIKSLTWRYKKDGKLKVGKIKNLDAVFLAHLEFFEKTPYYSFGFSCVGGFIGGEQKGLYPNWYQIAMLRTDRRIDFKGTMCEDMSALYGCS